MPDRLGSAAPVAAFLLLCGLAAGAAAQELQTLTISGAGGTHEFSVEIADDPAERAKGLMYRRSLEPDRGMLFDFGTPQPISMWMKNTYIPLDMLFIEADGTVRRIAERTTPHSERSIPSNGPVRYVLEIMGGQADALGIEAGDVASGPAFADQ
jgi:uncharacterized membrane protein (UPF0127 family)